METVFNRDEFQSLLRAKQEQSLDLSGKTMMQVINAFIDHYLPISPNIRRNYRGVQKQVRNIEGLFDCTLMPWQITDKFWMHFIAYCVNEADLALSSVQTYCSQLLSVLSWSAKYNCRVSASFDDVDVPRANILTIALDADEVSHIYHFDINTIKCRPQHKRTLEQVRDMFVLSCNLGQRHSDMIRIDEGCFDRHFFTILQQKTGNQARVDLERMSMNTKMVTAILKKYDYKAPYAGDIANYNRYLHELLRRIGGTFNDLIKKEEKICGVIKTSYIPKWKLVGSHTARRTFISINTQRGFSQEDIRRASGHKSITSFERYICYED